MKSFYLTEKCNLCQAELYCYRHINNKFRVDCSECNKFTELEFNKLAEVKKKFTLKLDK